MEDTPKSPETMAAQYRAVAEEEGTRDYTVGREADNLAREAYYDAISRLMDKLMPVDLVMAPRDITGLPPYQMNAIATIIGEYAGDVRLRIYKSTINRDGFFYVLRVQSMEGKELGDEDVNIREWHLVHYLQRARGLKV